MKNVRHGKNVAQQIFNRNGEKLNALTLLKTLIPIELKQKSELDGIEIFNAISIKGIHFDKSEKNKWFMSRNKEIFSFIYTKFINGKIRVVCKKNK